MALSTRRGQHRTKTQELREKLTETARELGADARFPTVVQMCQEMGVSMTTMSSALVELEAQKIIYRKHGVGIFVSPQVHQKAVALVCDPAFFRAGTSPFWPQFIEGVRLRAASKNEMFRFYLALPSNRSDLPVPDDLIEDVRARRVDGVLFVGSNKPAVRWICDQNLPVVGFAGWAPHTVALDYEQLIRLAVERLASQGCRDIGFISWDESQTGSQAVLPWGMQKMFRRALEGEGLPFSPDRVGLGAATSGASAVQAETYQEQGYEATLQLFALWKQKSLPSLQGLVVPDDLMTRGVLAALAKLGIRPGHDIQVASHANRGSATLEKYADQISLVEFDPAALVQTLFDTLEELMAGRQPSVAQIFVAPTPGAYALEKTT